MWNQYRKTLIPTQVTILLVSVFLYAAKAMPLAFVFIFIIAMELGALVGAIWGARLKRRMGNTLDNGALIKGV